MSSSERAVLTRDGLDALIAALAAAGYRVCGPTVRDGAIVYDDIAGVTDLPAGWTDEQDAGTYRLKRRDDDALFGFVVGPQSWKKYLHPPRRRLWRADRDGDRLTFTPEDEPETRLRLHRRAVLRARGDGHPGPGPGRRALCRSALPRASRGRLHRRGQLRTSRRHLLLRLDGYRAARHGRASTCR